MPLPDDNSATFGTLCLWLAERVDLAEHGTDGTGAISLPTDAHDLDKLKRYVNRGYDLFLRANPKWSFSRVPVDLLLYPEGDGPLNVSGEAWRYRLPGYVTSQPINSWVFTDESVVRPWVQSVASEVVMRLRQGSGTSSDTPTHAACRPFQSGDRVGGQTRGWEVIFYPTPSTAVNMQATFRVTRHDLVHLDDRHVCGQVHDLAILAAATYLWKLDDEAANAGTFKADWAEQLAASLALDGEKQPRRVSAECPDTGLPRGRSADTPITFNGTPVT